MEKQRRYKMLVIVTLMFAVVALTVGFAAFQSVMKISSGAEVSVPGEEDFNIEISGATSLEAVELAFGVGTFDSTKWSPTEIYPAFVNEDEEISLHPEYRATIDNDMLTININNVSLKYGEDYMYFFLIYNNGPFKTYVSFDKELKNGKTGTCSKVIKDNESDEVSESLMNKACGDIKIEGYTSSEIEPYSYTVGYLLIGYTENSNQIDGEVLVNFDPVEFNFSTEPFE